MKRLVSFLVIMALGAPSTALAASCCQAKAPEAVQLIQQCGCEPAMVCGDEQTHVEAALETVSPQVHPVLPVRAIHQRIGLTEYARLLAAPAHPPEPLHLSFPLPLRL